MVDARGYLCPMPVVLVKKEIAASAPSTLEVLVDDPCPVENITRYAESVGYKVSVSQDGQDYKLTLSK